MAKELIPELHDILKLTTLQHDFSDFDKFSTFSPRTRTWNGVIQHHCSDRFPAYPTDRETFLLHLADGLAANFSRHTQDFRGESSFSVYKIWNPGKSTGDLRLRGDDEIIQLLKFLSKDPSFEEVRGKYEDIIRERAEDAKPGWNITSLMTHLILTGKFHRVFTKSQILTVTEDEIKPSIREIAALRDREMSSWQIHLFRCRFHFFQNPYRARDLNIFGLLQELVDEVEEKYSDNLIFRTSDELLMYSDTDSILEGITDLAHSKGFWVSLEVSRPRLDQIKPQPEPRILPGRKPPQNLYSKELPEDISPPLCEICQMAPATKSWPTDYIQEKGGEPEEVEGGVESLCPLCFNIRSRPSKLRKLKEWTEKEDTDIAWFRVHVDQSLLGDSLRGLYFNYLRSLSPDFSEKGAEVRFSLLLEFQYDYEKFLESLGDGLVTGFDAHNIETLLDGFHCVRIDSKFDLFKILSIYNEAIESHFPSFKNAQIIPLRTSIICSRSKFPFFEAWRLMEAQRDDLQISAIGHGTINTSLRHLDNLLMATQKSYRKGALFKLSEVAKISERLAELKFEDKTERRDFETYSTLKSEILPMGLDFEGILTLAKLLGERE